MKVGELIELRRFPAVVQAEDIRALRAEPEGAAARDFVAGYLGYDPRSLHALNATVRSLAQGARGGAFLLNGAFGSGKSHLLGLLTLLSDGGARDAFSETHPDLAPCLEAYSPRLTVHFSLDHYDARRYSLEDVFWREVRAEWARRGLPEGALALPEVGARGEAFGALDEALAANGLRGLVVCIDELSLFLAARPSVERHSALQGDAAFLQFLGQRARRGPLWVFAALQKNVEDIGELEAYSLAQIRDRYTTLPLSLAHLPSLIKERLIVRKDAAALARHCHETFGELQRALPRLDFGSAEWEALYPFYPGTVTLLEQVVARFLSRTRSAVLFCAGAVDLKNVAGNRVLAHALFEYVRPELEAHPDLRPLAAVAAAWEGQLPELAPDPRERQALWQLMEGLLLYKIAGHAPSVTQLANSVAFDAGLPGDGNYEYAAVLLERLRTRGSFLAVEQREGEYADRYTVDAGTRVGEMARRHTAEVLRTVPEGDRRVSRYAVSCCRDEPLPLATLETAGAQTTFWRNAPRRIAVGLIAGKLDVEQTANRVAGLAQPGAEDDSLLLIAAPFEGSDLLPAIQAAARLVDDARWRAALWAWIPRRPTHDEWELAREATARHLLQNDPALLDNRRGRAIVDRLKSEAPARELQLAQVAGRLLREGQVHTGGGLTIDAPELFGWESWAATLEALCEFALPHVFPKFNGVAPRLRVLTGSNSDALCLDLLRCPSTEPYFAAALERPARGIAEPLGVAKPAQGRWRMEPLRAELGADIRELVPSSGVTYAALESSLAKGPWGLAPEQTALAVCALMRSGDLAAFDGRGAVLAPRKVGLPLRRSVHHLRPGQLLAAEEWPGLTRLFGLLGLQMAGGPSFAAQEAAREALAGWHAEATAETELAQARLHQLRRRLHHTSAQWPATNAAWEQIEALLRTLAQEATTVEYLRAVAALDCGALEPAIGTWRTVLAQLEANHAGLMAAHEFLTHPMLVPPPELRDARDALLLRFEAGESLLDDHQLLPEIEAWRGAYAEKYRAWHGEQHNPSRYLSLRRLAASDAVRALDRLACITSRAFNEGAEVRKALDAELNKGCDRDGSLRAGAVVCDRCDLKWGERVGLRDPREIEVIAVKGIASFHNAVQEALVREYLTRQPQAARLLAWDGAAETLLPLLTDAALALLDEAFRPRRVVKRRVADFTERLHGNSTRREVEATFQRWLDGGENVAADDVIEMS